MRKEFRKVAAKKLLSKMYQGDLATQKKRTQPIRRARRLTKKNKGASTATEDKSRREEVYFRTSTNRGWCSGSKSE